MKIMRIKEKAKSFINVLPVLTILKNHPYPEKK
jgi:hypothetical protein